MDRLRAGAMLWQSPMISGMGSGANGTGVADSSPTDVNLLDGHTYVGVTEHLRHRGQFRSRDRWYAAELNRCTSVAPNLGNLVYAKVLPGGTTNWSATVSAVPEPLT